MAFSPTFKMFLRVTKTDVKQRYSHAEIELICKRFSRLQRYNGPLGANVSIDSTMIPDSDGKINIRELDFHSQTPLMADWFVSAERQIRDLEEGVRYRGETLEGHRTMMWKLESRMRRLEQQLEKQKKRLEKQV